MPRTSHPVFKALSRWEEKGLLASDLVRTLRGEVEAEAERESRRWSQYLLAATGGAVLVIAGGTFLAWAWPDLGAAGQSVTLGVLGILVLGLGARLPREGRWVPVAYLLQLSGSILLIMALVHSERAWEDGSPGGVGAGVLGLLIPPILLGLSLKRAPILAAFQAALGLIFLGVFLDRALALSQEAVLWILDGALVLGLAFVGYRLSDRGAPAWALPMAMTFGLAAMVLLAMSGDEIWGLDAYTILPMDAWLLVVAGFAWWGLREETPPHLRRDWYEGLLALCVVVAIPFSFITTLEALETGATAAALAAGAVGTVGLLHGLRRRSRLVLGAGCLALLVAAWYYGAEMAGALGAVLALGVMSGLLFWGAFRVGRWKGGDAGREGE